jgi:hypothetical protein
LLEVSIISTRMSWTPAHDDVGFWKGRIIVPNRILQVISLVFGTAFS